MATATTNRYAALPPSFSWHVGRENKRSLTPSQKGCIFANYQTMTIQQLANLLGKSYTCIEKFLKKYNLSPKKN